MESVDVQISNPRGFTAIQRDPDKPNFNPAAWGEFAEQYLEAIKSEFSIN